MFIFVWSDSVCIYLYLFMTDISAPLLSTSPERNGCSGWTFYVSMTRTQLMTVVSPLAGFCGCEISGEISPRLRKTFFDKVASLSKSAPPHLSYFSTSRFSKNFIFCFSCSIFRFTFNADLFIVDKVIQCLVAALRMCACLGWGSTVHEMRGTSGLRNSV